MQFTPVQAAPFGQSALPQEPSRSRLQISLGQFSRTHTPSAEHCRTSQIQLTCAGVGSTDCETAPPAPAAAIAAANIAQILLILISFFLDFLYLCY